MSFFFNDTATTEIYTLSLHDALPIAGLTPYERTRRRMALYWGVRALRSEEHTSELQSHHDLVCRLLLEKKNYTTAAPTPLVPPVTNARLLSRCRSKLIAS